MFGFNSTATNLAFGAISDSFVDVTESTVSWVVSGFFIASAAFLPLGGRLADRVGHRRVFNVGLIGIAASALASAAAPTIWVLIAARVAQAISAAMVIPASLAMVLPDFPAARRPSAIATWAAAGPLAAALAPSTAAALLEVTSWRWVYFISAPAAAAILVASYLIVADRPGTSTGGRLDVLGTGLAVISISAVIVGITQGSAWGWFGPLTVGAVLGGLALGAAFVRRSMRHPTPLINVELFRRPEVAVANVGNFFMSITSLSIWLVWPLFMLRVWEFSTTMVGLAVTIGPICAGIAAVVGGRVADRYGQRWLMVVGCGLTTMAVTWAAITARADISYWVSLFPTIAMFGSGWGISNPSMNSYALSRAPQENYGEVNAAFNTIRNLAGAIGTAGAIAILGNSDRVDLIEAFRRTYIFLACAVALSFTAVTVGTWMVERRRRLSAGGALDARFGS